MAVIQIEEDDYFIQQVPKGQKDIIAKAIASVVRPALENAKLAQLQAAKVELETKIEQAQKQVGEALSESFIGLVAK